MRQEVREDWTPPSSMADDDDDDDDEEEVDKDVVFFVVMDAAISDGFERGRPRDRLTISPVDD